MSSTKDLQKKIILHGAGEAFKGGWNQVKLYFMLGLPTETEDDMKGIAHLAQKIAETYYEIVPKEQRKGKVQINVSTSFFVPKPFHSVPVGSECSVKKTSSRRQKLSKMKSALS